jgi:pimeloyl-ACP methyl ester carboxylesterase/nucleoside-diphosphate-sugar epimerase
MNMIDAFVTGGTGLIGRRLVVELTRMGQATAVLMRNESQRAADYKAWVADHDGDADKLVVMEGDLSQRRLGLKDIDADLAQTARNVYHLGGMQGFGLAKAGSEHINVGGTKEVFRLAQCSSRLNRFVLVSGFRLKMFHDMGVDPGNIKGNYESSKLQADRWVREAAIAENVPVTFIHPSVVIGDSQTGETTQFGMNFFTTVEDLWRGKVPAIPGSPRHWLPMTTVDYVAAFMARITELAWSAGEDFTVLDEVTPPLGQLLQQVAAIMSVKVPTRYIPIPLLTFLLNAGLSKLTGQDPEALHFIDTRRYDVSAAKKAAAEMGLTTPDFSHAVHANISYQLATEFGHSPYAPGAGLRATGDFMTYGQGDWRSPQVVLLHGLPLDLHSWDGVVEALPDVSYLRVDLPGNGRSSGHFGVDKVAWLDAVLEDITRPVLLVGHSLGTEFAVHYAAARPHRVAGLLLISPHFLQGAAPRLLRHAVISRVLLSLVNRRRYEALVTGRQMPLTPMLDSGYKSLRRASVRSNVAQALAAASQPAVRGALVKVLSNLYPPVHLAVGEDDPLRLPTELPVTTIPKTSHHAHVTHPEHIAALIIKMIGEGGY